MSTINIPFTKMHGAGNDYIYLNCMEGIPSDPQLLSIAVSDRHFGIGADGLVLILPSEVADFRMRMFNADGSEAEMCGNASRCIGKYVYEKGLCDKTVISLETAAGIRILKLSVTDNIVTKVQVDMGEPILKPAMIPVISDGCSCIDQPIEVEGKFFRFTAVSMGNPHAVIFLDKDTDKLDDYLVHHYGKLLENSSVFPHKTNVEFVIIDSPGHAVMRVWERGSGATLACGTGACATTVAAALNNLSNRRLEIDLAGGTLNVDWNEEDNHVYLSGGAEFIADGVFYFNNCVEIC